MDEKYWDKQVDEGNNNGKSNSVLNGLNLLTEKVKVGNVVMNYNDLFVRSKILERIIPRQIDNASEFEKFNQFACKDLEDFEKSDMDAVNEVS